MKTLYFDCSAGISGDMCVAALLDTGIPHGFLIESLTKLKIPNYEIKIYRTEKQGVEALKFDVLTDTETSHRHLADITDMINGSGLSSDVKSLSKAIFFKLGEAESKAHNISIDQVHFHEVGAVDSIIDIVSAAILLNEIAPDQIISSPIAVGKGTIEFCHGTTDLPVPAVRHLLAGAPLITKPVPKELTTPTGAAIVATTVTAFSDHNPVHAERTGKGAGTRDLPYPNMLRVTLGSCPASTAKVTVLQTQIDDMNPELYESVIEHMVLAGALDAYIQPCIMKKSRMGTLLTVICRHEDKDALLDLLFAETTTFGIRVNTVDRIELDRHRQQVATDYGRIDIKVGSRHGKIVTISPEYEACRKAADKLNVPIRHVYDAAKTAVKGTDIQLR